MALRPLIALLAAAMAASYFLPWFNGPLGNGFVPNDVFTDLVRETNLTELPLQLLIYLGSFAGAALLAVLAVIGWAPRLLGLLVGAIPIGLTVWLYADLQAQAEAFGLPLPGFDELSQLWSEEFRNILGEVVGLGLWAYAGGSVLLLIASVFAPSAMRAGMGR